MKKVMARMAQRTSPPNSMKSLMASNTPIVYDSDLVALLGMQGDDARGLFFKHVDNLLRTG